MPVLKSVQASSSFNDWLFPIGSDPRCLSSYCEARLLDGDMLINCTKSRWCAGRCAPVTLCVALDEPAASMELCPNVARQTDTVAFVLVDTETGQRNAYQQEWRDAEWTTPMALPTAATRKLRIEFVSSASCIGLRAMRFR